MIWCGQPAPLPKQGVRVRTGLRKRDAQIEEVGCTRTVHCRSSQFAVEDLHPALAAAPKDGELALHPSASKEPGAVAHAGWRVGEATNNHRFGAAVVIRAAIDSKPDGAGVEISSAHEICLFRKFINTDKVAELPVLD